MYDWLSEHKGFVILMTFIAILFFAIYYAAKADIERADEFMEWCVSEYKERGYKDIHKYCRYLYRGKVQ